MFICLRRNYVTELLASSYQSISYTSNYQAIKNTTTGTLSLLTIDNVLAAYFGSFVVAFSLVALVANSLVIAATLTTPCLRTVTNYYIVALAAAETLTALFFMLFTFGTFNPPIIKFIGKQFYTRSDIQWLCIRNL